MSKTRSKVMIMTNNLVKRGMSRRTAMLKAWVIAKASALRTKVKGTSRRQNELEQLAGVPIRVLQARTGHSQASTLVNIYSHAIRSADEAATEALDNMLTPANRRAIEQVNSDKANNSKTAI